MEDLSLLATRSVIFFNIGLRKICNKFSEKNRYQEFNNEESIRYQGK